MDNSTSDRPIMVPMMPIPQTPQVTVNAPVEQNGQNGYKGICMPHLPNRDPIDLQFKDITYTVKLGFYKGKSTHSLKFKKEFTIYRGKFRQFNVFGNWQS